LIAIVVTIIPEPLVYHVRTFYKKEKEKETKEDEHAEKQIKCKQ